MPDNIPAISSAVAAIFAALAALLTWRVHRSNLIAAVRPELMLLDVRRAQLLTPTTSEIIAFSIRNLGRGHAFNIIITGEFKGEFKDPPTAVVVTRWCAILAPNESMPVDGEILLYWSNAKPLDQGDKYLGFNITIICFDIANRRYETRLSLMAFNPPRRMAGAHEIASGLHLLTRTTRFRSAWMLRLTNRARPAGARARKLWNKLSRKDKKKGVTTPVSRG